VRLLDLLLYKGDVPLVRKSLKVEGSATMAWCRRATLLRCVRLLDVLLCKEEIRKSLESRLHLL